MIASMRSLRMRITLIRQSAQISIAIFRASNGSRPYCQTKVIRIGHLSRP